MATKKKTVKKPGARKKLKKPAVKKKAAGKRAHAARAKAPGKPKIGGLSVQVTPALEARLKALANGLAKPLETVLVQAMTEFADTWEDHLRTVKALDDGNDRMQLVAPTE